MFAETAERCCCGEYFRQLLQENFRTAFSERSPMGTHEVFRIISFGMEGRSGPDGRRLRLFGAILDKNGFVPAGMKRPIAEFEQGITPTVFEAETDVFGTDEGNSGESVARVGDAVSRVELMVHDRKVNVVTIVLLPRGWLME